MRLHSLKNVRGARRRSLRVGRGEASGSGKTSGSGHKGQWSRKGHKGKEGFEGGQMRLIRRIPKLGFKNPAAKKFIPVNVGSLSFFDDGAEITPELLRKSGLAKGRCPRIKILGTGDLSKKLTVKANEFSASAREKIEASGGKCEVVAD